MPRISDIAMLSLPERPILRYTQTVEMDDMSMAIGRAYGRLSSHLRDAGGMVSDVPYVGFKPMERGVMHIECCFPLPEPVAGDDTIESLVLPAQTVIYCMYLGPYNLITGVYDEMTAWLVENGYSVPAISYETYYNGQGYPMTQLLTKIIRPAER